LLCSLALARRWRTATRLLLEHSACDTLVVHSCYSCAVRRHPTAAGVPLPHNGQQRTGCRECADRCSGCRQPSAGREALPTLPHFHAMHQARFDAATFCFSSSIGQVAMRCCCSQASRLCCLLTVLGMCHKAALPCHVPEFIIERSLLWSMQFIFGLGRRLAQAADPTCQRILAAGQCTAPQLLPAAGPGSYCAFSCVRCP